MIYPRVFLNKNEEKEIQQGFPWVFDNEISHVKHRKTEKEEWKHEALSECTVEDHIQRLFVAQGFSENWQIERVMFCTYPLDIVSRPIFCSNKLLLNWFLRDAVLIF